jgi:hypothetical protein
VTWSADDSAVVHNVRELDVLLDRLAAEHGPTDRIIVIIDGPGEGSVYHGVGGDLSFVSSCEMPYLTTVADDSCTGEVDYFFQGHYSHVACRNLIPTPVAREIVRRFFVSGRLPATHAWEPI